MVKDGHKSKKVLASSENFITSTPAAHSPSNEKDKLTKVPTRTPGHKTGNGSGRKSSTVKAKRSSDVVSHVTGTDHAAVDDSKNQVRSSPSIILHSGWMNFQNDFFSEEI